MNPGYPRMLCDIENGVATNSCLAPEYGNYRHNFFLKD